MDGSSYQISLSLDLTGLKCPLPVLKARRQLAQMTDGKLTVPEIEYLAQVSDIFGFEETDFQRMLALHAEEGPRPWDVLGVDPAISDDALRHHWRALVRDNHPDRLIADGMPEEFINAATERLARINAAFDSMARSRGMAGS